MFISCNCCLSKLTLNVVSQVVESLKQVNFSIKNGEQVWFDSTGAAVARYEVVNWQRGPDGSVHFKPVGYYDASLPMGQKFLLKTEDIVWPGEKEEANTVCNLTLDFIYILYVKYLEKNMSF